MAEDYTGQTVPILADFLGRGHPALARKALPGERACDIWSPRQLSFEHKVLQCERVHGHAGQHMAVVQKAWG